MHFRDIGPAASMTNTESFTKSPQTLSKSPKSDTITEYFQKTIAAIIGGTIPAIIDIWLATSSC
jgi:hypothetical protein